MTKIEWGWPSGSATRAKGRPRRAVHSPDSISSVLDLRPGQARRVLAGVGAESNLLGAAGTALDLAPGELDDHRLEDALFTTVDGHHLAGSRRGEANPRHLLVFEEQLAALDGLAHLGVHGGPKAGIVGPQKGDASGRACGFDLLCGLTLDGQTQATFGLVQCHRIRVPLRS